MGDLIERLRAMYPFPVLCGEAADELARLRAEVKGLNGKVIAHVARILKLEQRLREKDENLKTVYAQRDELRRRIAEAERFDAAMLLALGIPVSQDDAFAAFALVRLDAEEGK